MNVYALVASLLVAFVYIRFLRQMDVFEPENWKYTLICFFLGVVCVGLVYPVYAYFPFLLELPDEGPLLIRLRYHMQSVAMIEEAVKIIPFLIFLSRKRILNESFDYIKYASVGAMGFAALENVLYFSKNMHIIEGRAFYTAIMHMFTSSLIAYCMYFWKIRFRVPMFLSFLVAYVLAVGCHGLFNALISSTHTYYLGMFLVVCMLIIWGRMMNNTLNQSDFFQEEPVQKRITLAGIQLLLGWAFVFLYAALVIGINEGQEIAWDFIREGVFFGAVSGIGLFYLLARPRIRRGLWFPLLGRLKKE